MNTVLRLRLEMGASAVAFCKAHPDTNTTTAQVAAKLIELSAKAEALLAQQRSGLVAATTAVVDKAKLRAVVAADLQALMKISRAAARQNPEITVHRRIPTGRNSAVDFYTAGTVALADATALKEVLTLFGLSDELITSLTQGLAAFKAANDRKRDGIGTRVGAGADLEAVAHDIISVVSSLDAVHAVRFRGSPDLLAAWKSARNVAWPVGQPVEAQAPKAPSVPVTPVSPAAPVALVETPKAA